MTVKFEELNPLLFCDTKGIVTPENARKVSGLSRNGQIS